MDAYFDNFRNMKKSDVIEALAALANESRLDVFRVLIQQGRQGLPAGEIAERLGLQPATLSFHLTNLWHAGLVERRRESRRIIYSARYEAMSNLMGFLMENCCQGHPEACAFVEQAVTDCSGAD